MRASEFAYTFVGPKFVCAYCGDPAETEDHTVPSWFVAGNPRLIAEHQLFKVAACNDCNHRAGAAIDRTFIERKRRIAASIRLRRQGPLGVAHWPDDEIAQSGRGLKPYIKSGVYERRHLLVRLETLDSALTPDGMPSYFFSTPVTVTPVESRNAERAYNANRTLNSSVVYAKNRSEKMAAKKAELKARRPTSG